MVTGGVHHDLVGSSAATAKLIRFIAKAAPVNSTVLLQGESGTGKELVAHALHRNSRRSQGPFVAVNCAALPESLLESELFGHEKGAFTGAVAHQKGKFELAANGTLLLDEAGELSASIQAKLLRALQERTIDRIGGKAGTRRCPGHRRHESRSPGGCRCRSVSRGPLLPPEGALGKNSRAARAA